MSSLTDFFIFIKLMAFLQEDTYYWFSVDRSVWEGQSTRNI